MRLLVFGLSAVLLACGGKVEATAGSSSSAATGGGSCFAQKDKAKCASTPGCEWVQEAGGNCGSGKPAACYESKDCNATTTCEQGTTCKVVASNCADVICDTCSSVSKCAP